MADNITVIKSSRVVLDDGIVDGNIVVKDGKIADIVTGNISSQKFKELSMNLLDVGNLVVMPGIIDTHVHINEPGRTEWEGFHTATRAAAVGGITTVIDMPLNSVPPTTTCQNLSAKMQVAKRQCFVDVGFWGGVIPGNQEELVFLLSAGVRGFKCFLIDSGMSEFPNVTEKELHVVMEKLTGTRATLLFHAEVDVAEQDPPSGDPTKYSTFLHTRPACMEVKAVKLVCRLCLQYNVRCHIVHLSSAECLSVIEEAKALGAPLTVETCHHYLTLSSNDIPDKATEYKCTPPIRTVENKEQLWEAVNSGLIDMVVSDHSPCTEDLKNKDTGNFLTAWGGIASLQFGLSLFWKGALEHGLGFQDVVRVLSKQPAEQVKLANQKGSIKVGHDADFVVWDPNATFKVTKQLIQHKNKLTPYMGMELPGVVHKTVVRGHIVYDEGTIYSEPLGKLLL